ncbi:MAG TPA: hypothetical protein VK601_15650 [Kofleriaceae bacterium]|nr:hypothetical protein [Kofleriaceae bacterium]
MKRLAIFSVLGPSLMLGLMLAASPASADDALPPMPGWMDTTDALNPVGLVQGSGIKVGEGTVLQPQVGIETGVVSNVFYESTGGVTAGLLRLLIEIGTGSLPNQRLGLPTATEGGDTTGRPPAAFVDAGDFQYSANAYLQWDQYLSTNDSVTSQGGLGGGLLLRGVVNPQRPLQFAFQDSFSRLIRPTNFESPSATNRDINTIDLRLTYAPPGRSLGGYLYYRNTIDVFEDDSQQFANRLQNQLGLQVGWQWLPLTRLFGDVSIGFDTGIGSSEKVNSTPLTAVTGIQTALTLNTTLNAHVGYTNGFYASGPSYSTVEAGVVLGYRYSPLGRVTAMYAYDHADSINANFYRDHLFQLTFEQYFAPFVVFARPELRLREYEGTIVMGTTGTTRDDTIAAATVGIRYNFRDWIAGTLDYRVETVQTDFRYSFMGSPLVDPSYVRHELMLGVRAAY